MPGGLEFWLENSKRMPYSLRQYSPSNSGCSSLKRTEYAAEFHSMSRDDFIWHVRLEGDEARRRAGGGARQKAAEEAAKKGRWRSAYDRFIDARDDERAWRRGAEGEEEVARRLRSLEPHGWMIFHDLTIGPKGANLDHLAIGSAGVFALNTKNHLGKKVWVGERAILVNGFKTDYLRSIRRETAAAENALSKALRSPVVVRGVIVVLADELTVKQQPEIATVVGRRHIADWLSTQPPVLPAELVTEAARVARLPSTWGSGKPGGVLDRRPRSTAEHASSEGPTATSSSETPDLRGVRVKRWRRYGKDRLYVNDASGQALGYLDNATGEVHVESGTSPDFLREAIDLARRSGQIEM